MLEITFIHWEFFSRKSRQDQYNRWFKIHENFFFTEWGRRLDDGEVRAFLAVVCACVRSQSNGKITLSESFGDLEKVRKIKLISMLEKLKEHRLIEFNVVRNDVARLEDIRGEKKREEYNQAKIKFDIELLYQRYPRKLGKKAGLARLAREIVSQADYDALTAAIDNYAALCQKEGTEEKFIKHFSTFSNCWRDYVDIERAPKATSIKEEDLPFL